MMYSFKILGGRDGEIGYMFNQEGNYLLQERDASNPSPGICHTSSQRGELLGVQSDSLSI
jgi:hypothetical protein